MQSVKHMLENKPNVVHAVGPQDMVFEAIKRMATHGFGALVVLENELLVGILSERDYARKVILQGKSSKDTPVAQIMSTPVITTTLSTRANECMRLMTDRRIRHLPVVESGKVLGVLSIGDLLKLVIATQQREIEQLNQYISG